MTISGIPQSIYDASLPVTTQNTVNMEDAPVRRLLELILLELRINNEQLAALHGASVSLDVPSNSRGI